MPKVCLIKKLDVNVVGAFGQQPRTTKDIMMLKDRNEALKRSTVYFFKF